MDYGPLASVATSLIDDFGAPVVLRRTVPGAFDEVTGIETGATTQNITVNAVRAGVGVNRVKPGTVEAGDMVLYLDGKVEPLLTDAVVDGSDVFKIVSITPTKPDGSPLLYEVQVRK